MTFEAALDHVLAHEGGYVNHPEDPGGATNMGITARTLETWRGAPVTPADVKALDPAEAAAIYRDLYWDPMRCGDMPAGVALIAFDAAVNHGVRNAARLLQAATGARRDGVVGPKTLAAIAGRAAAGVVSEFAARRMHLYGRLSTFKTFGLGWSRRLMNTHAAALGLCGDEGD